MAKSNYSAPLFQIFPIALATNHAGVGSGCHMTSNQAELVCPVVIPLTNESIFSNEFTCTTILDPDDSFLCYHVPTGDMNIFNS